MSRRFIKSFLCWRTWSLSRFCRLSFNCHPISSVISSYLLNMFALGDFCRALQVLSFVRKLRLLDMFCHLWENLSLKNCCHLQGRISLAVGNLKQCCPALRADLNWPARTCQIFLNMCKNAKQLCKVQTFLTILQYKHRIRFQQCNKSVQRFQISSFQPIIQLIIFNKFKSLLLSLLVRLTASGIVSSSARGVKKLDNTNLKEKLLFSDKLYHVISCITW